ncbi:tetratricopeptide repeat-containing sensor histidine kinase [Flavobacterium hauense]
MKKIFIYISVLLFTSLLCYAQIGNKKFDELYKKLHQTKSDTARINTMDKIANLHMDRCLKIANVKSLDSARIYLEKVEKLSKRIHSDEITGKSYLLRSRYQYFIGDTKGAMEQAKKAMALFEKNNDLNNLCEAYRAQMKLQAISNTEGKLLALATKALKIARRAHNKITEAEALENIAYDYIVANDYTKALSYFNEALKVSRQARRKNVQGTYSLMAGLYTELGKQDKALEFMLKAIDATDKIEDPNTEDAYIYNLAGVTYRGMKDTQKAIAYFKKAIDISKQYFDNEMRILYELNLVGELLHTKNPSNAKPHIEIIKNSYDELGELMRRQAVPILIKSSIFFKNDADVKKYADIAIAEFKKGNLNDMNYLRLQRILILYYFYTKDYNLCRTYVNDYKGRSEKLKSIEKLMFSYDMLSQLDSVHGNNASALQNYKTSVKYKDSLFNEAKNSQLTEHQVKYDTEKKEKDNQLLKKQAELQQAKLSKATLEKNLSLAGILLLILSIGLIYRRYVINKKMRTQTTVKNNMLENLLNEKEWLLKEIHHRVKNNLQIVMSLLNTQVHFLKDEAAIEAIKNSQDRIHSMSLLHKKLYQSENTASINIRKYIEELTEYFKATFNTKNIIFILDVDPIEIPPAQAVPLALIINETIINSLKHAFPDQRPGTIEIKIKELPENRVSLIVKDNGIGTESDLNNTQFQSLGIKLIKGFSGELSASPDFINDNGLTLHLEFLNNKNFFEPEAQSNISA